MFGHPWSICSKINSSRSMYLSFREILLTAKKMVLRSTPWHFLMFPIFSLQITILKSPEWSPVIGTLRHTTGLLHCGQFHSRYSERAGYTVYHNCSKIVASNLWVHFANSFGILVTCPIVTVICILHRFISSNYAHFTHIKGEGSNISIGPLIS